MPKRQTAFAAEMPNLWLVSDARNDEVLDRALRRLPRGFGLIFRHYHLAAAQRRRRFAALMRIARQRRHVVALAGTCAEARLWGADAAYGSPRQIARGPALLRLAAVHDLREIGAANRGRADAVLLSPAFSTRSHPGARALGPARFRLLGSRSQSPVIALGGMSLRRARRLAWPRWAAIDGLCGELNLRIPKDS